MGYGPSPRRLTRAGQRCQLTCSEGSLPVRVTPRIAASRPVWLWWEEEGGHGGAARGRERSPR
eukprot:24336-Eustigmatos_ZCMA.PRE.1